MIAVCQIAFPVHLVLTVAGGPGGAGGGTPYVITFSGSLKESPEPLISVAPATTPLSGGGAGANITDTVVGSTGSEVCEVAADCQAGEVGSQAGAFGTLPTFASSSSSGTGNGLVIAPAGVFGGVELAELLGRERVTHVLITPGALESVTGRMAGTGPDARTSVPALSSRAR